MELRSFRRRYRQTPTAIQVARFRIEAGQWLHRNVLDPERLEICLSNQVHPDAAGQIAARFVRLEDETEIFTALGPHVKLCKDPDGRYSLHLPFVPLDSLSAAELAGARRATDRNAA